MQTGGCDVSGQFMRLRNEKQTGSAEIYTPDQIEEMRFVSQGPLTNPKSVEEKNNYFLSFILQVSMPWAATSRLWLSSSELVIDM